jgi:hypothetical protein
MQAANLTLTAFDYSHQPSAKKVALAPQSHQRSWWIVHTLSTNGATALAPQSHQRSWWIGHTPSTNGATALAPQSHQRSWWIVHTPSTNGATALAPQSHQRSWWIVHTLSTNGATALAPQSHNAVGGSFTPNLPAPVVFNVQLSYARAMQLEPIKEFSWGSWDSGRRAAVCFVG